MSLPLFVPPLPLTRLSLTRQHPIHRLPLTKSTPLTNQPSTTHQRLNPKCELSVPNSPSLLVRSWAHSRSISSTIDLSRRFISVLFLSNHCHRAAYAEKQLVHIAHNYSVSRRLLVLSAGLHSKPGDLLPWRLVAEARSRGIEMAEERPCASFEVSDLEYYDFVVVVDRDVKDQLLRQAESFAHTTGGHLYEWERKIRLLCDFDGGSSFPQVSQRATSKQMLDIPTFQAGLSVYDTMDAIQGGCEGIIKSLIHAGL